MSNIPHKSSKPGGIPQQRTTGEPTDKRTLLALAWKTSLLATFVPGLPKLGRRYTTALDEQEWKILEEQLQADLAMGRSPSTFKAVLLAATSVVSMGIAKNLVPKNFWKYVNGAEKTWNDTKVLWDRPRPSRQWLPNGNGRTAYRVGGGNNGTVDSGGATRWGDGGNQSPRSGRNPRHDRVLGLQGQPQSILMENGTLGALLGWVLASVGNSKIRPHPARHYL